MSDYSNSDEQIYELTKKFTEEDVSAIIEWVIQYDREQCNSNKDKEVTLRAKTLIDMVDTSFYYTGYLDGSKKPISKEV